MIWDAHVYQDYLRVGGAGGGGGGGHIHLHNDEYECNHDYLW